MRHAEAAEAWRNVRAALGGDFAADVTPTDVVVQLSPELVEAVQTALEIAQLPAAPMRTSPPPGWTEFQVPEEFAGVILAADRKVHLLHDRDAITARAGGGDVEYLAGLSPVTRAVMVTRLRVWADLLAKALP